MRTIAELRAARNRFLERVPRDVLVLAALVLSASAGFGLGYLAGLDAPEDAPIPAASFEASGTSTGPFVASKNGTRYYLPWCAGVERIGAENRVQFASEAAARRAGYAPAAGCAGLSSDTMHAP